MKKNVPPEGNSEPIPIEQELLTPDFIHAIETSTGKKIQGMTTVDATKFELIFGSEKFVDSVSNFFRRLARKLFSDGSAEMARTYLTLVRDGLDPAIAIKQIRERPETHSTRKAIEKTLKGKTIPPDPASFTPNVLQQAEDQIGLSIAEISVRDSTEFTVQIGTAIYTDRPSSLFQRIAGAFFESRKECAKAKHYLVERKKGKSHEEALATITIQDQEKPKTFPTNPSEISVPLIIAIEERLGKIENIRVDDTTELEIVLEGQVYKDKFNLFLQRLSRKLFSTHLQFARTKQYLVLIRDGQAPIIETDAKTGRSEAEPKRGIPVDSKVFTTHFISELEIAIGKTIEDLDVTDNIDIIIRIDDELCTDKVNNFLSRISAQFFGVRTQGLKAKRYLVRRKMGDSHQEALEQAQTVLQPIPITPNFISVDLVRAIETVCQKSIDEMSSEDNAYFIVTVGAQEYKDTPMNIFTRIARKFFGSQERDKGRKYLKFRKEGLEHDLAIEAATNSDDAHIEIGLERLEKLQLEDAIALFQNDPLKLRLYIQFAHPELSEEEIDRLVMHSFRGLICVTTITKEEEYLTYDVKLPKIRIEGTPEETMEEAITITGRAPKADAVYIAGVWNRRVKVSDDGTFSVRVPLKIGQENEIRIMAINREKKIRSDRHIFIVEQKGEPDDIEALIRTLCGLGRDTLAAIRRDPGRQELLVEYTEQFLIKKFTHSFKEGVRYVEQLIKQNPTPAIQSILRTVLANFRKIQTAEYPNIRPESPMYFFQKFCEARIQKAIDAGEPGIILANDPGLGKTRNAWAAVDRHKALIVAPNSVVSPWGEEAAKFLKRSDILTLQNLPYPEREELLRTSNARHRVTNIEFVRDVENDERFNLLSDEDTVIVHDEAHSRTNLKSQQTRGMRKLRGKFLLLLTATPAKNSKTFRRMMHSVEPDNPVYTNDAAFERAFPTRDPQALRTLSLIKRKRTIRFRKQDVLEEMDASKPLSEQLNRLPRKEFVPPQELGEFTMHEQQAWAIYEMFLNWDEWSEKYNKYSCRKMKLPGRISYAKAMVFPRNMRFDKL